jgi:hypothetical protein
VAPPAGWCTRRPLSEVGRFSHGRSRGHGAGNTAERIALWRGPG